jgi:hypothetical protein
VSIFSKLKPRKAPTLRRSITAKANILLRKTLIDIEELLNTVLKEVQTILVDLEKKFHAELIAPGRIWKNHKERNYLIGHMRALGALIEQLKVDEEQLRVP